MEWSMMLFLFTGCRGEGVQERCLLGVDVAQVLEARALVDKVRVGRQVVLAEGGVAGLARKQQPARLSGRPPALPTVVVRTLPRLHCVQLLHIPHNLLLHWPYLYGQHGTGPCLCEGRPQLPQHMPCVHQQWQPDVCKMAFVKQQTAAEELAASLRPLP